MAEGVAKALSTNGASLLQRSTVPSYFPQFRNAAALAHLAHLGRGPRYVLVGGIAWYDPKDIDQWLESNKKTGPTKSRGQPTLAKNIKLKLHRPRRRGRPTKLEQMLHSRLFSGVSNG
jgi:hypothetical protein